MKCCFTRTRRAGGNITRKIIKWDILNLQQLSASVEHGWLLTAEDYLCIHVLWGQNLLHCPFPFFQVQSIKQNNSSLKQSLNEGVDVFRPAEVSLLVQLSFFTFTFSFPSFLHTLFRLWFLFTFLCLWSLLSLSLSCHLFTLSFPNSLQILLHPLWDWD